MVQMLQFFGIELVEIELLDDIFFIEEIFVIRVERYYFLKVCLIEWINKSFLWFFFFQKGVQCVYCISIGEQGDKRYIYIYVYDMLNLSVFFVSGVFF